MGSPTDYELMRNLQYGYNAAPWNTPSIGYRTGQLPTPVTPGQKPQTPQTLTDPHAGQNVPATPPNTSLPQIPNTTVAPQAPLPPQQPYMPPSLVYRQGGNYGYGPQPQVPQTPTPTQPQTPQTPTPQTPTPTQPQTPQTPPGRIPNYAGNIPMPNTMNGLAWNLANNRVVNNWQPQMNPRYGGYLGGQASPGGKGGKASPPRFNSPGGKGYSKQTYQPFNVRPFHGGKF